MTDLSPVVKRSPDAEHTFWVYSPEGDGMTFWKTEQERNDYTEREIKSYLDDRAWNEWIEEVEWVCAGVVTHRAKAVDIMCRVGELDDEGYDENDEYWEAEAEIKCNYALRPIQETHQ
jgi:hypothetical protein